MQEIADSADLAVGTLYNYFRAEPGLLAAILRRETEDLLSAGERILGRPSLAPAEAVAELVRRLRGIPGRPGAIFASLYNAIARRVAAEHSP